MCVCVCRVHGYCKLCSNPADVGNGGVPLHTAKIATRVFCTPFQDRSYRERTPDFDGQRELVEYLATTGRLETYGRCAVRTSAYNRVTMMPDSEDEMFRTLPLDSPPHYTPVSPCYPPPPCHRHREDSEAGPSQHGLEGDGASQSRSTTPNVVGDEDEEDGSTTYFEASSDDDDDVVIAISTTDEEEDGYDDGEPTSVLPSLRSVRAEMRNRVEDELTVPSTQELTAAGTCAVCFCRVTSVVILPCRHGHCATCTRRSQTCPRCRGPKRRLLPFYP